MMKFYRYLAMGDNIDVVLRKNILQISRTGEDININMDDEHLNDALSLIFEEYVETDADADLFYKAIEERKNLIGQDAEKIFLIDEEI